MERSLSEPSILSAGPPRLDVEGKAGSRVWLGLCYSHGIRMLELKLIERSLFPCREVEGPERKWFIQGGSPKEEPRADFKQLFFLQQALFLLQILYLWRWALSSVPCSCVLASLSKKDIDIWVQDAWAAHGPATSPTQFPGVWGGRRRERDHSAASPLRPSSPLAAVPLQERQGGQGLADTWGCWGRCFSNGRAWEMRVTSPKPCL